MILLPVFVFVFGLIIGSFLNVVILRLNTGRSIARGRSACASCARKLSWYELVPVVSFLLLKGKCRTCTSPISFQYAVVELTTAVTFLILYTKLFLGGGMTGFAFMSFLFSCVIAALLMVILIYDIRHKIIPDPMVYAFIALSFVSIIWKVLVIPGYFVGEAVVAGPLLALPFFLLWYFSDGRLMGFGDVKLMLGIGWLLGLSSGGMALLFSFWIGGIVGMFLLACAKRYSMKSQIPFAPFLIIGTFIVGVWNITFNSFFGIWF